MQDKKEMNQLSQDEMDALKRRQKLEVMHKGPCSSPRTNAADSGCLVCTCPMDCPLHGRCCDCIAHHKLERLEMAERGLAAFDPKWMPHCIAWFDERNGVNCDADPDAGSHVITQEDAMWIQQEGMKHAPPPVPGEPPRMPTKYEVEQMIVKGERMLRERDKQSAQDECNISGIIFDLDGVICTTDRYHYLAWKEMADSIGVYFDETINNRLRGVSRMASLDIILERADRTYTETEKLALAARKNSLYQKYLQQMSPADLSCEVKDALDELRRCGLRLAIGSSSKNAKLILNQLGLGDFFDAISDGTNISRSKPDPEVFLMAADMLGLSPSACLVVEDALAGIDAASAGGFQSAGIGEAATHPKATYPMERFSDLLKILKK